MTFVFTDMRPIPTKVPTLLIIICRGVDGAIEARGMAEAASIEGAYVECAGDDGMLLCRYAVGMYATPPELMVFSVIK